MEELKVQQMEALEVAGEYCTKLIAGIENVIAELKGEKYADTDDFLKHIVTGINWTIEIYNGTKTLLEEEAVNIDKDLANKSITELNQAYDARDDYRIADALEKLLVIVKDIKAAADKICK